MDKKKKYFLIKFIALCINILYYFFELKKKFNVTSKLMNIEINFKYDNIIITFKITKIFIS